MLCGYFWILRGCFWQLCRLTLLLSACWALLQLNVYLARASLEELQAAHALHMARDAVIQAAEALNAERASRTAESTVGHVLPSLVASSTGGFSHLALDFMFQLAKPSLMAMSN